jgi:hypothetical protein
MKEEVQIELLKLAIQTISDLEKNKSSMLANLQYRARFAKPDKDISDYGVLLDYVYLHIKSLIAGSTE